jgi:hypothetical protein
MILPRPIDFFSLGIYASLNLDWKHLLLGTLVLREIEISGLFAAQNFCGVGSWPK